MRKFSTLILLVVAFNSFSQQGDFLLSQHIPENGVIDNTSFEITNDQKERICIASSQGILKYDGEAWDYYKTPSAALSLAVDSNNIVYAGCIGTIGMIDFEGRSINFKPLIEEDSINDLFLETIYANGKVYFMGSQNLIVYNIDKNETALFQNDYLNIYSLDEEIFVNTQDGKTYEVADSLIQVNTDIQIAYASNKKEYPELIIDFEGQIHSYENNQFKKLPQNKLITDQGVEVQEIKWVNDSLFVCSTFESGLLFFNTKKPSEITVTNYHSGLPDNEIFALHTDNFNSVWVAHEFGITQISPLFPASRYSHFPGLEGNLTSIVTQQDQLWLTTSLGMFYFDSDTTYTNQVYYEVVQKDKKPIIKIPQINTTKKDESTGEKPLLKRLFGKKKRVNSTSDNEPKKQSKFLKSVASVFEGGNKVEKVKGKLDKNTKYIRKVRKVPVDVNYSFKKVEGTAGKFLSLVEYGNKLLGVGSNGIYEIVDNQAEIIISENIRSFAKNNNNQIIIGTTDLEVKSYTLIKDVWIELTSQQTNDIIVSIKEDDAGTVWMAGSNSIYKAAYSDTSFSIAGQYELNNLYLDNVGVIEINKVPYFINSEGYFYYDDEKDAVVENKSLLDSIGSAAHHLVDGSNSAIWVYNGKFWYKLDSKGNSFKNEYLGLFPNLRGISSNQEDGTLWLLTGDNDILKYDPNKKSVIEQSTFFVRKVSNEKGEIDISKKFSLSHDENFLSIDISKPDYLGVLNPEFQYKLIGLHSDWSGWSRNKSIDFSFIPEGEYKLMVKSRDAFGREEEAELMQFSVNPPYWQTPWFYAIQILFFGGLVYYSSRLNQDSSKNRLLRGGLTLLTLVLIIEFLQSAIGSLFTFKSSPVVEFLIDAIIAFMIFPLERLLRELMTQGKVKVNISKKDFPLIQKNTSTK